MDQDVDLGQIFLIFLVIVLFVCVGLLFGPLVVITIIVLIGICYMVDC